MRPTEETEDSEPGFMDSPSLSLIDGGRVGRGGMARFHPGSLKLTMRSRTQRKRSVKVSGYSCQKYSISSSFPGS